MGRDGVDADVVGSPFTSGGAREHTHAGFRGAVRPIGRHVPAHFGGGGEVDDVAAAALLEVRIGGFHEAEGGDGTGEEALLEFLVAGVEEFAEIALVGVVDQDIEAAERLHGVFDRAFDVGQIAHVAQNGNGLATEGFDLGADRI